MLSVYAVIALVPSFVDWHLAWARHPEEPPPCITVTCNYPGANAREVMNTVASPIEDEVNGVEDMLFMSSSCLDDGSYSLGIAFEEGTDRDKALMRVQDRVQQAMDKLPAEVKQRGLQIRCPLGILTLRSKTGKLSRIEVSDYMFGVVQPALLRVPGVGDASIHGPKMAMRVWLDPDRMAEKGMNSEEVIAAIKKQNVQASLGSVGASPAPSKFSQSLTLIAKGRLKTPEEFGEIIVRHDANGGVVRLKDVARTEYGEENYMFTGQLNGDDAVLIVLQQKPGSDAGATLDRIYREMKWLANSFPEDLEWGMQAQADFAFSGIGVSGAVEPVIFSRGDDDLVRLVCVAKSLAECLRASPLIERAEPRGNADTRRLKFNLDRVKAEKYHVSEAAVYATLQYYLGSSYANDENIEAASRLYVRSETGAMIPIVALGTISYELAPREICHFNKNVCCTILCTPAPGVSTDACIKEVERILVEELPPDYGYDWADRAFRKMRTRDLASRADGKVRVLKGVEPGEKIVVQGVHKLVEGMKVTVVPASKFK